MRVNVDPIWGLIARLRAHRAARAARRRSPSCVDPDGVRHELARDRRRRHRSPRSAHLVAGAPLVLADGHHRFETALNYRNELRAAGNDAGRCGRDHDVRRRARRRRALHRADPPPDRRCPRTPTCAPGSPTRSTYATLGPNTPEGVDALVAAMRTEHGLGLVDDARPRARGPARRRRAPRRSPASIPRWPRPTRPSSRRSSCPASPTRPGTTATTPTASPRSSTRAPRPRRSSARRCRSRDTRAAAVDRVRMPQKTTFFWPKPRTGMVFRTLD